jgi:hypothetical protein
MVESLPQMVRPVEDWIGLICCQFLFERTGWWSSIGLDEQPQLKLISNPKSERRLKRRTLKPVLILWGCGWFTLSDHLSYSTFVAKAVFDFSASLVVDLLKFSRDTALLLKQALNMTNPTL